MVRLEMIEQKAENRRRQYLVLMGVEPYYARKVLENAGHSPVFVRVKDKEEFASAEYQALAEDSSNRGLVAASAALAPPSSVPTLVSRKLHYRCIDSSLAILTQDHWQGEGGAGCAALLRNICMALGKEFDSAAVAEPAICNLSAESVETSEASLERLCRRDGCPNLLVFAHNGEELFPEASLARVEFVRHIGGTATRVTLTRSLREMLAFPDLKKYCWKDLQPLRRRLLDQVPQGCD